MRVRPLSTTYGGSLVVAAMVGCNAILGNQDIEYLDDREEPDAASTDSGSGAGRGTDSGLGRSNDSGSGSGNDSGSGSGIGDAAGSGSGIGDAAGSGS